MDLHYLEIFNTVAKNESYKKASDILHISQPALSIQIKKLEEQIGLKLFNKIGNKVHLSENGLMLYEYTKKIFSIISDLENNISDKKNFIDGTLNIGGSNTPGSYLLPEIIGGFKKTYPQININLHIANTTEIAHLINNGTLDFAVNGGNSTYSNYIYVKKLFEEKLVFVASPENRLVNKKIITVEDLKSTGFVVHKTDSQLYTYYKNFIKEFNLDENVSMYLGNNEAIKKAVCSNLGISLIPYATVKFELKYGLLKVLNFPDYHVNYPYSLIYNKNKSLSYTSKKFIEVLKFNIQNGILNEKQALQE